MVTKMNKNGEAQRGQEKIRYSLPVKRPFGRILLDGAFIEPETLTAALAEQMRTNRLLGDIHIALGAIDRAELEAVLWVQRDFSTVEDSVRAAAGVRRMLGEFLLMASHITQDQLNKVLDEQKKTGEKLGEIMVRFRFLDKRELNVVLSFQSRLGDGKNPSCLMLGELLISTGYISHKHLNDALERQRGSGKKLGEVLVEVGYAKQHHVDHGLRIQEKLVAAALIAALSQAPITGTMTAQAAGQAMSTQMQVTAVVTARASLHVFRQPLEIIITNADIRRGYLDVNEGSLVEIRNNSRAGVNMTFETHGLPFKEVLVSCFGREVALGPNGGIITQQIIGTVFVALNYRFIFDEYSQAGTYAWPLSISVNPIE